MAIIHVSSLVFVALYITQKFLLEEIRDKGVSLVVNLDNGPEENNCDADRCLD